MLNDNKGLLIYVPLQSTNRHMTQTAYGPVLATGLFAAAAGGGAVFLGMQRELQEWKDSVKNESEDSIKEELLGLYKADVENMHEKYETEAAELERILQSEMEGKEQEVAQLRLNVEELIEQNRTIQQTVQDQYAEVLDRQMKDRRDENKQQHEREIGELKAKAERERRLLLNEHKREILAFKQYHKSTLDLLAKTHARDVSEFDSVVRMLRQRHQEEIAALKRDHANEISQLNEDHKRELKEYIDKAGGYGRMSGSELQQQTERIKRNMNAFTDKVARFMPSRKTGEAPNSRAPVVEESESERISRVLLDKAAEHREHGKVDI